MKKIMITSFLIFFITGIGLFAQNTGTDDLRNVVKRKNNISWTLGGMGLFSSINYSRVVAVKPGYFVNIGIGIGFIPVTPGVTFPHQMSFNFGKRTNFVEVGLGGSLWTGESDESVFEESAYSYNLSPVIGWRKHFKNNLTLRIYANPLIHISGDYFYEESAIVPYFGGSFGYQF